MPDFLQKNVYNKEIFHIFATDNLLQALSFNINRLNTTEKLGLMTKINSRLRSTIKCFISQYIVFALMLAFIIPVRTVAQDYYPVHATVQVLPPYSLYLSDYSNGFRDRLVITLYNRDLQQQTLDCRLRLRISNTSGFCIESRDEVPQRSITVEPNVPLRLTSQDIAPYLQPGSVKQTGTLRNGRLPEGMMTFSVQVVEQHTGRILSPWASGRAWLETKKPPMLVMPEKDETIAFIDPQHILFRWYPQHQGLSGVEYELHIREMLDNCQNPAAQYDSGKEVFTTKTRQTLYNYSNIDPELIPGHTYAWKVRAVAMDGIDEIGVFDNDGYSETGWFRLVRGCDAPVIDRAEAGYRKLDLGWHGSADDMRYTVQYSAEKENGSYNWTDTTTIDNETTLYGLTPGVTYSYRVGALCSATGKPVYSQIGTVKIPNRDSISAANCGVKPEYKELSKERKTDLKVGDRVTVGGDYTMLITELNNKGNGVYGGKGRLTFTWVFFVGLEVTFDDLVVNTDGYQIDGTVNTVYDGTNTNIANLDQLSDGGVNNRESRMSADGRSTVMDFSVPPMPRSDLSEDGNSVIVYDLSGAPHTIEIPKNAGGGQSIPFSLTDIDGNTWRFESCDSVVTDSLTGSQKTVHGIKMTKLDAVSGFSKDKLSDKVKARIAFENGGQYAFDNLSGRYYGKSSKLGKDYLDKSGLGDGTYAPWKLVPMGKSDKIKAGLNPTKIDIDIASVRFVDADGHDLESSYDSDNAVWTVSLTAAATEGNYYNVYAVAKPKDGKGSYQTIGKLFVVSYKTTKADIVLLPVEKHNSDISELGKQVSDIFAPCGVEISITESDALVGNTGWDLNGDGKLSLTNDAETDNVKRSAEMKALENIVKSMPDYDKNVLYLVYVPKGSKSSGADVEGNWGRGRQIGYVFEKLEVRTVAHEVGHAFTLQHTFDRQYGGNETRGKTDNLMDYNGGTQLDAFQWEILAHNAPKIVASVVDGAEDNWFAGSIVVTPNFEFTTIPETSTISSQKYVSEFKVGTLTGFKKNKKFYEWHDGKYVDINNEDSIYTYTVINPSKIDLANRTFLLFYNTEFGCGKSAYIDVPLDYKEELVDIIKDYNINKYKVETEKKLIGLVKKLMAAGQPIPCVREGVIVDSTSNKNGIPLYCEANGIKVLLNKAIEALNKITANTKPSVTCRIIKENYSSCLFDNLSIETRMAILKSLFQDGTDGKYWRIGKENGFGGQLYLSELILTTPEKDRVTILKEGFMADNYRWLQILFEEINNNDVHVNELIRLVRGLGGWVCRYYNKLNIPTSERCEDFYGWSYTYPFAPLNPVFIGDPWDSSESEYGIPFFTESKKVHFFDYGDLNLYFSYYLSENPKIDFSDGNISFSQKFNGTLASSFIIEKGSNFPNLPKWDIKTSDFTVNPFEPVVLISNRTILSLGMKPGKEEYVPAFVAALYAMKMKEIDSDKETRESINNIAIITAAVLTPFTDGGSWAAYSTILPAFAAIYDKTVMIPISDGLDRNENYDEEYGEWVKYWNDTYSKIMIADACVGGYQLVKTGHKFLGLLKKYAVKTSIGGSDKYAIFVRPTNGNVKEVSVSGKSIRAFEIVSVGSEQAQKAIRDFYSLGKNSTNELDALMAENYGFKNFSEKYAIAYEKVVNAYTDGNVMLGKDEALSGFYSFLKEYGTVIGKKNGTVVENGVNEFLKEMFAGANLDVNDFSRLHLDKFKAGTTTIEALIKYMPLEKNSIRNILFEGKINKNLSRYFDVKFVVSNANGNRVYFLETKNYRSASQVFCKINKGKVELTGAFGQFKVYLTEIEDFDQLKYVFQNRGFKAETAINNLKKAIANDAEAAYNANGDLWKTVDVFGPEDLSLEALNANKKFNDAIKNCIKLTD